jgi:RNA polymerase sigma-70 factor (ECF subfamily)
VEKAEGERIAQAFFAASASGDVAALRAMLAETVVLKSDGGGKVLAFINPIVGMERVLRLLSGLHRKYTAQPVMLGRPAWIDGLPGYISHDRGNVLQTTALAIEDGRIIAIYITRNPDKLGGITAQGHPLGRA